jgi:hypothetical protein
MEHNQSNLGLDQCHNCGVRRKQVANPTTNYGFVLPTPTDLVTDLPADFDVALQGVDTQLKALQPGTTLGDLAYSSSTANTNTRLAIGSTGNVLTVAGGVPTWAAPAGGSGMTLLSTTTISGDTTISSIDQTYTNLFVTVTGLTNVTGNNYQQCRINGSAGNVLGAYYGTNNATGNVDYANSVIYMSGLTAANYSLYTSDANSFTLIFNNYASTTSHKNWSLVSGYLNGSSVRGTLGGSGDYQSNTAISSLQFKGSAYALNGGTIKVYGVK